MGVCATRATWKLGKEITAIQKLLLLALADRAGENGECWPSLKRIESDTNLNRKTIIENRNQLMEMGLIEYTGRLEGKQKQIPVMRLCYVDNREGNEEFEKNFTSTEIGTSTENGMGTSTENGTGYQYRNWDTEPKRIEPKKEPKIYCAHSSNGTPNNFESFWSLYPSKKAKKKCEEIWKRKKLDNHSEDILTKLEEQISKDSQWRDGFIPNPSTYLNQERWNDEISLTQEQKKKIQQYEESKKRIQQDNDARIMREIYEKHPGNKETAINALKSLKVSMGIKK